MYAVFVKNNHGTMRFSKFFTLSDAKESVSKSFRAGFVYGSIYDQARHKTIERTPGTNWTTAEEATA